MAMRTQYLEFHDDAANSHKYYQAEFLANGLCKLTWGRIDTAGQTQVVDGSTGHERVAAKINKGYELKMDSGRPANPLAKAKAISAAPDFLSALAKIK